MWRRSLSAVPEYGPGGPGGAIAPAARQGDARAAMTCSCRRSRRSPSVPAGGRQDRRSRPKPGRAGRKPVEDVFWVQPALLVVVSSNPCRQTRPINGPHPNRPRPGTFPTVGGRGNTSRTNSPRFASKSANIPARGTHLRGQAARSHPRGRCVASRTLREMENPAKTTQRGRGNRRTGR